MVNRIRNLAAVVENQNSKISELIEDEAEWATEEAICESLSREAVAAVAAVEVASARLQRSSVTSEDVQPDAAPIELASRRDNRQQPNQPSTSTTPNPCEGGETPDLQPALAIMPSDRDYRVTREYDMTPRVFSGDRLQFRTLIAEFDEYVGRLNDISAL